MARFSDEVRLFKRLKYFDTDIAGDVTQNQWMVFPSLNLIRGGAEETERVGLQARVRSLQLRGLVSYYPKGKQCSAVMYIYVMWDKQCNRDPYGVIFGDMYQKDPHSALPVDENQDRFVCLKRIVVNCRAGAPWKDGSIGSTCEAFDLDLDLDIPIWWYTEDIDSITSSNLLLLVGTGKTVGDDSDGDWCQIDAKCRIRYQDKW